MQWDMPLGPRSSAKKGTVISSIQADEHLSTLLYGTKTQSLRRFVYLIIGRTALEFSVVYDHHWESSVTLWRIELLLQKLSLEL